MSATYLLEEAEGISFKRKDDDAHSDVLRVLLVGNSYTYYNNLPSILQRLLQGTLQWKSIECTMVARGGYTLGQHSTDSEVLQQLTEPWDVLLLQDNSKVPGGVDSNILHASREALKSVFAPAVVARQAVSDARVIVYGTWGHRTGCASAPLAYPSFASMERQTTAGCLDYVGILSRAGCKHVQLASAGVAFRKVHEQARNQHPPESLFCRLYEPDDSHPSPLGSYLAASVIAMTIMKAPLPLPEATVLLPADEGATPFSLPVATAKSLQDTAWAAVEFMQSEQAQQSDLPSFLMALPVDQYDTILAEKVAAASSLLRADDLLPLDVSCDVHASRPQHYRQRVGFGIYDPRRAGEYRLKPKPLDSGSLTSEDESLSYVYWDAGEMVQVPRSGFVLACDCINSAMPHLLGFVEKTPELRESLRSVKFLCNYQATDMICSLIYGPSRKEGLLENWKSAAISLQNALQHAAPDDLGHCKISILGRTKQCCTTVGDPFVIESGLRLKSGYTPLYRQPEQAFSNPNAGMAIHTLNWLEDCSSLIKGKLPEAKVDLLELYCGNGNHTMALSKIFDRVLAVELNSRLVEACQDNLALNNISNVEVRCVNAGSFCRSIVKSRRWESRPPKKLPHGPAQDLSEPEVPLKVYQFQVILVDPPRAGLDDMTCRAVAQFDHVIYISCNPYSLQRDMLKLRDFDSKAKRSPLQVSKFAFFDHFPFTKHNEVGVLLSRFK